MEAKGIKVSIIIPVYNVAPYIGDCLRSVMRQTYQGAMECLIIDDCGTDDSIAIAEGMIREYNANANVNLNANLDLEVNASLNLDDNNLNDNLNEGGGIRFRILHHDHNRGLAAARNTGIQKAIGDYLFFIDSDDEIIVDCLERLIEAAQKFPRAEMIQGEVKSVPYRSYYDMAFLSNVDYIEDNRWLRKSFYRQKRLPANAWNKLLKRAFVKKHGLFFKEGLLYEDELWMFHVVKYLKGYGVVHHPTYIHRCWRTGSIMTTKTAEKWVFHWSIILDEIVHCLDNPFRRELLLRYLGILISIYGKEGFFPPSHLLQDYRNEVLKEHLYGIYYLLLLMEKIYPFCHEKLKKIINILIKEKID